MYKRVDQANRLLLIDVAKDVFSDVEIAFPSSRSVQTPIVGSNPSIFIYVSDKSSRGDLDNSTYNMPFLFLDDDTPWIEANSYLHSLVLNTHFRNRPTDYIRACASKLLDYKIFCERNGLDWLDFSGKRPSQRPTYKYFHYLVNTGKRSNAVINQYTGVVYDFYKHVSENWHEIDLARVDTVKDIKILIGKTYLVDAQKRSQTKRIPTSATVKIGYVRESGEDLRPLTISEYEEYLSVLNGDEWTTIERLIFYSGLCTGARKQSVLTMRMKHLKAFTKNKLNKDGTYTVHAGPRTGIDTKFDKPQQLYFPDFLADQLIIYANSSVAKQRRSKFHELYRKKYPHLAPISDDDMYLFLSEQGGCYYIAEDDPRYPFVKTKQIGQVTSTLVKKLQKLTSSKFPKDFSYHWLRATYAYQYYLYLNKFVDEKRISYSDQISMIQKRLHHENREMTEHYLKLFNGVSERLAAQDIFEESIFNGVGMFSTGVAK